MKINWETIDGGKENGGLLTKYLCNIIILYETKLC